ncbi:MAG: hypothetical protein KKC20_25280 [Proteobacteria bacterium]|nr:hypothetical protein [Pseudomonadota bacterium]
MELNWNITKQNMIVATVLLFFAIGIYLAIQAMLFFEAEYEKNLLDEDDIVFPVPQAGADNSFKNLSLEAQAYFVWDARDQRVLATSESETQLPLASLTKLMTILIAIENSLDGDIVTIDQADLNKEGENNLAVGESWRLTDLIDFMVVVSSNDAAHSLASVRNAFSEGENEMPSRQLFLQKMNEKAEKIGMTQTYYLNESGLDATVAMSGGYGSAKDTTILLEYILREYPSLLDASAQEILTTNSDLLTHQIQNTNQIVAKLPGVIASKTGWTDLAGGNLAMAFDIGIGHNIIIVLLGSSKEGRFTDMEKLYWASIDKISRI